MQTLTKEEFEALKSDRSAEEFVENLFKEGSKTACDSTESSFTSQTNIPDFYDEQLYKRGQEFYHKNIFAFFFGKFHGLLAVLAIPSTLKILQHTNMSSNDMTAYRRYLATVFHMVIWYDEDFKPGSKLWQSVAEVRKLHNSASSRSCAAGLSRISQKDMALTQFGFLGFPLIRSRMVGIHRSDKKDWEGITHLWRVIGHLMGIEERFNICSGSVENTKQICELLISKVFKPEIEKRHPDFLEMSSYMVNGMWCMLPFLQYKPFMCYLHLLVDGDKNDNGLYFELDESEKSRLNFVKMVAVALKWRIVRFYLNWNMYMTFFLMRHFPFLAYYRFGMRKAHVRIPVNAKGNFLTIVKKNGSKFALILLLILYLVLC